MNHIEFASALIRLDRNKIGLSEACTLFVLGGGSTSEQIGKALGTDRHLTKSRVRVIRNKGLVDAVFSPDGTCNYKPTDKGLKIIRQTLNEI